MASTEPTITDAVLRWPCCAHCLHANPGTDDHDLPCIELVDDTGPVTGPRCQL